MNTKDARIRIGVAGAGMMGRIHIRIINELDGLFKFVGVYDPNQERAKIAESYEAKAYSDYQSLLDDVEAVVIACPTSLHKKLALEAAEKNVHVLCEKPVAESLSDAKDMYAAFSKKSLKFTVSHVERFNPVVRTISDLVKGLEIVSVEIHRCSPFDSRIYDVDVVADLMIHDLDIVLNSIFNTEPTTVKAIGRNVFGSKFVDYAQAALTFPNGAAAFITASRCTEDKIRTICIHAKGAYIEGDMLRRTLSIKRGVSYEEESDNPKIDYTQSNVVQQVILMDKNPLKEEISNFGHAILYDSEPLIVGEEVIRSMTVLDKVEAELYEGRNNL